MTQRLEVTAVQVAAAKLMVKRARARGCPVDPAVQAIADAPRAAERRVEQVAGVPSSP